MGQQQLPGALRSERRRWQSRAVLAPERRQDSARYAEPDPHSHRGDLGKGWLELCTEEDYKAAASTACDETTTPCTSRVRVDPPQIEERATAPLRPCVEAGVILHALPPGFDERSQEMYRQLLMLRESAGAQREPAPLAQPAH